MDGFVVLLIIDFLSTDYVLFIANLHLGLALNRKFLLSILLKNGRHFLETVILLFYRLNLSVWMQLLEACVALAHFVGLVNRDRLLLESTYLGVDLRGENLALRMLSSLIVKLLSYLLLLFVGDFSLQVHLSELFKNNLLVVDIGDGILDLGMFMI